MCLHGRVRAGRVVSARRCRDTVRGMVEEFDAARALGNGVPDRERAWEFLRGFAAGWQAPLVDGCGLSAGEVERAEARLGLRFPAALREFYVLLGARKDLTDNQDPLLPPGEVFVHDGFGGVLVFRAENQGCAYWGVRLEDLGLADPPVFVQSRDGWLLFMDRLSLAAVELVLSESLFAPGRFYNACELPEDLIEPLPRRFARLPLPDYPLDRAGGVAGALVLRSGSAPAPGWPRRVQLAARSDPHAARSGCAGRSHPGPLGPGLPRTGPGRSGRSSFLSRAGDLALPSPQPPVVVWRLYRNSRIGVSGMPMAVSHACGSRLPGPKKPAPSRPG